MTKNDAAAWAARNPTLMNHVKKHEKLRLSPYKDVGGYAIGYGAHTGSDGSPVTAATPAISKSVADAMLARDLYERRSRLAILPNWEHIPGNAKQALLDVSMGKRGILSQKKSPNLWNDLTNAGPDPAKLLTVVKRHYTTYRKSDDPNAQAGLEARRIDGMKTFFNEDYAYQQDAKGGDTSVSVHAAEGGDDVGEPESSAVQQDLEATPAQEGGPRIVINPSTFHNEKDAMCVAWNEALRIVMEETGFDPVSEPTDAQREFFADTAYADDELQLRRTILARICTFDTSVKDPTDEQIQEAIEFVSSVMEGGFPRNEWEQSCLKKILDILSSVPIAPNDGSPRTPVEPPQEADPGATASELGGQTQKEEERDLTAGGAILADPKYDAQGPAVRKEDELQ